MGIRVHKAIGYGLTDLKADHHKIKDPRVNYQRFREKTEGDDMDAIAFSRWMELNRDPILALYEKEHPKPYGEERCRKSIEFDFRYSIEWMRDKKCKRATGLHQMVVWEGEFGLPNVLQLIPPQEGSWYRYDNVIDWFEESQTENIEPRVVKSNRGIYPWVAHVVRAREPSPEALADGVDPNGPSAMDRQDHYFKKIASRGAARQHYEEDWRPEIPISIIALMLWLDCFNDVGSVIQQLRPLIYVYWS